ncbi:hypothetical protein BJY59DRAFT_87053 [Rhodotorula toruloides]
MEKGRSTLRASPSRPQSYWKARLLLEAFMRPGRTPARVCEARESEPLRQFPARPRSHPAIRPALYSIPRRNGQEVQQTL